MQLHEHESNIRVLDTMATKRAINLMRSQQILASLEMSELDAIYRVLENIQVKSEKKKQVELSLRIAR